MGKIKYQKEIEDLFKKSPVVEYKSIERIVKKEKNIKQYTKQLIRNLLLKNKIRKLTRGNYTSLDEASLIVYCFKPAYLGLQDALSFHNLWDQETIPIIITAKKVVPGIRKVMGNNVLIRKIDKNYLFGFDYSTSKNIYLPYSDIEKTFIDMIYFKEKLNEEVLNNIIKQINIKKLKFYLNKYPLKIQNIVLGLYEDFNETIKKIAIKKNKPRKLC